MVEETDIAVVGAGGGEAVLALDMAEEPWSKNPDIAAIGADEGLAVLGFDMAEEQWLKRPTLP